MSTRSDIRPAVLDYIEGVASSGGPVDVNAAAFHLAREFPQSGYPLHVLCEMIAAAAQERGLLVVDECDKQAG